MNNCFKKRPYSSTVETVESIETFPKRLEIQAVRRQKVSTVNISSVETIESRLKVSTVSIKSVKGVETICSEKYTESIVSSEFQQFQQFQRGIVGCVSQ